AARLRTSAVKAYPMTSWRPAASRDRVRRDEIAHPPRVGRQQRAPLRTRFQVRERLRAWRVDADGLAQGCGEFGRQRRLDADQRDTGQGERSPDVHAIRSVRVDEQAVALVNGANGGDAIGMRAASR